MKSAVNGVSQEIVKVKLDVVFKKLFTSDNKVLKAFIGDILDISTGEIKKIEVLNPNILPAAIDGKQSQLDLNMLVDDKTVNVEIQLQNKGDYKDRSVYYWSKLYSDQLKRGELYKELKKRSQSTFWILTCLLIAAALIRAFHYWKITDMSFLPINVL